MSVSINYKYTIFSCQIKYYQMGLKMLVYVSGFYRDYKQKMKSFRLIADMFRHLSLVPAETPLQIKVKFCQLLEAAAECNLSAVCPLVTSQKRM